MLYISINARLVRVGTPSISSTDIPLLSVRRPDGMDLPVRDSCSIGIKLEYMCGGRRLQQKGMSLRESSCIRMSRYNNKFEQKVARTLAGQSCLTASYDDTHPFLAHTFPYVGESPV
jgi:hypothetical protein